MKGEISMIETKVDKLLEGLNPIQRQIVRDTEGRILVLAGAGSGKTRVLTHRISYLLENQVSEWNILAVTFTNKAAREMRERVRQLTNKGRDVWIGTFHSICLRILSRFGSEIGYEKFTVIDDKDQKKMIKDILELLGFEFKPEEVLSRISKWKNELKTPDMVESEENYDKDILNIYREYEERKKDLSYFDFDDLIMKTVQLLNVSERARERLTRRFKYIMVDEYQDTNHAQFRLIDLLSTHHQNLFVVGDCDQSIYRFRGADISNILMFQAYYPDSKVYKLEQNYRSTETIVKASNTLIENNTERLEKTAYTYNKSGDPIVIYQAQDDESEADFVTAVIGRMHELENRPYSDFCVLYRTNRQSRAIEASLFQNKIPYTILKGVSFYDRKEIKDILSYLRVIYNPDDDLAWRRIINVPKRGIGDTTIERIQHYCDDCKITFGKGLLHIEDVPKVSPRAKNKIKDLLQMIDDFRQYVQSEEFSISGLIDLVISRTRYKEMFDTRKEEDQSRLENIGELINIAARFEQEQEDGNKPTLQEFLSISTLSNDVDELDGEVDKVTLMTVHSAKGLEFPVVFVIGLEEKIFPHIKSIEHPLELEEERRLAYVAFTRAEEKLFLTYCRTRFEYGRPTFNQPSRFLMEIPDELVKRV